MKKLNKRVISLLSLAIGLACSSGVQAAWTFDQSNVTSVSGSSGDPAVSLAGVYAANGVGDVGFATGAKWNAGTLSLFSGNGQGMYTGTDAGSPYHAIDNNGNTEAVLLNFGTTSVVLNQIGLGYTSDNLTTTSSDTVDISLFRWVGGNNVTPTGAPTPLVGQTAATMSGWQLVGNYGSMALDKTNPYNLVNAGGLGSSWWLISAYNSAFTGTAADGGALDQGNDFFKLYAVNGAKCTATGAGVCGPSKVPEPTSLALFGAGLLGLIGARRRRNAAAV
jgi:hypothetical protein